MATHPLSTNTPDIATAARAIACLAELVDERLSGLQKSVADYGAGISSCGDWDDLHILLDLAIEQAHAISRASE